MKVLMIVDMQVGFINEHNNDLIEKINGLILQGGGDFNSIIYTKFVNKDFSSFVNFLNWNGMKTEDKIAFAVDYQKGAPIFEKTSYGISNEQIQELKDRGIKEVYLCGTDLDACVLAIGYQLFDNNIRPIFLLDCCGSSSKNKEIKNLDELIIRNFGKESIRK